jgi:hypothetical protein
VVDAFETHAGTVPDAQPVLFGAVAPVGTASYDQPVKVRACLVAAVGLLAAGCGRTISASASKVTPDQPIALATSRDGALYIGDRGRNEILVWMPTGGFRIAAGTGRAGLTGDGGPADRAEIDSPGSLVSTSNGALYFTQAGRRPSSVGMRGAVIREITPSGTIRTVAGLHPSCPSGTVRSVPAESALFDGGLSLSVSPNGGLAVEADVCETHEPRPGPMMLSTSSGRFVRDVSNPVPAVASVSCGFGVPGPGFRVFACESGGGNSRVGHPRELLVVRSDGSSAAYPDYSGGSFAVGDGEVLATYDDDLVRVTSRRLVPLLTSRQLGAALHTRQIADIYALTVDAHGDVYFVSSIFGHGCQNRILERTRRGTIHQIWSSSASRKNTCG